MVRTLRSDRRIHFMSSALKLFAANGVQSTSTAEIARKAGTAAGTLFIYFPNKQALINEVVLWISQQEAETINNLLDPSLSVRDTFFVIWDGSIRWLLDNIDAYQFSQQIRDTNLIPADVARETGKYFSFYYDAIQKGFEESSIKPYPIDLIGGFLYQDIVATLNSIRAQSDPAKLKEVIQQGFDLFWDGIKIK